jgi:hypothetical protein
MWLKLWTVECPALLCLSRMWPFKGMDSYMLGEGGGVGDTLHAGCTLKIATPGVSLHFGWMYMSYTL